MSITLPPNLVEARRTPLFDFESLPQALASSHMTTVWATLHVQEGDVGYTDLQGDDPRNERLEVGDSIVIPPHVVHRIDPSTDALFFVQFHREPSEPLVPRIGPDELPPSGRVSAPWQHRGRDLDDAHEIFEMVTRFYADVVQDDLLAPHFRFDEGYLDWQALIGNVSDFWNHVLLYAPDYAIDPIDEHRPMHERNPFTPELFDRWLQTFRDTVDGGWTGPNATRAKKRATGLTWVMAKRMLGPGAWRPAERR